MTTDRASRLRGTLLGLAWGDAYGCPIEGWSAADISRAYDGYAALPHEYPWDRLEFLDPKRLKRLRPLGLHSDDTQQALGLLHVALSGDWNDQAWSQLLVDGMKVKAWRGYGRNFSLAVAALKKGKPPHQAGSSSAGIGAAMRIAPLAAAYDGQSDKLAEAAMCSSLVTHGDIRAGAIAFAVAWTARRFIDEAETREIRSELPHAVREVENEWLSGHEAWAIDRSAGNQISGGLRDYFASSLAGAGQIRQHVSDIARPLLADGFTRAHPNQGFALLGGLHALAMALRDDADPSETLREIVVQGFDTDTVAAIAGGLLGARFGCEWIPAERLLDRQRIESWCDALAIHTLPPESMDELLRAEADWTRKEREFQQALTR